MKKKQPLNVVFIKFYFWQFSKTVNTGIITERNSRIYHAMPVQVKNEKLLIILKAIYVHPGTKRSTCLFASENVIIF